MAEVVERAEQVIAVRADASACVASLTSAMRSVTELRSFLAAAETDLAVRLRAVSSFPEPEIAQASRDSLSAASKIIERGDTLSSMPGLADALDTAQVTPGHVDAVTRAAKSVEPSQRDALFDRVEQMIDDAATTSVAEFARRVRAAVNEVRTDDGMAKLERQRRATSMSTWTDDEGMWNMRGRFDPVTALSVSAALDRTVEALFAEAVPDSCPSDPIQKQKHLRALAFARIATNGIDGDAVGAGRAAAGRARRAEFVAVIDVDAPPVAGAPTVQWPIPIEIPGPALATLVADADIHTVVIRNGAVLHAPGNLNLGRSTRLANRAQRRALRSLYATCAIPDCTTTYDKCKLHHIQWWRHGGRTDLHNLLPVCSKHHHAIHDQGWNVHLGENRELTLTLPDGSIRNTGPPNRRAA